MSNKETLAEHNARLSAVKDGVQALVKNSVIPSGTLNITENGTHDVTEYASVTVNVEAEQVGSDGDPATLVVQFGYEEDNGNVENDPPTNPYVYVGDMAFVFNISTTGAYSIDGGEDVYFEDETKLVIDCFVGSIVRINISSMSGGCTNEYEVAEAVGCDGETLCTENGHEPYEDGEYGDTTCGEMGGCYDGVKITVTSSTASAKVWNKFA